MITCARILRDYQAGDDLIKFIFSEYPCLWKTVATAAAAVVVVVVSCCIRDIFVFKNISGKRVEM
jgi:putative flippase GtrA